MHEFELIVFSLAVFTSAVFYIVAVLRYRIHKQKYPLAKGYKKLFRLVRHGSVLLVWFLVLLVVSIYFAYLLFLAS